MSAQEPTIAEIQAHIEDCKIAVAQRDLIDRLRANPDFQKLIIQGFLRDECARYTQLSVNLNLSKENRDNCLGMAQAAGYLKEWMNDVIAQGNKAANDIERGLRHIEELRMEEATDDQDDENVVDQAGY